MQILNLLNVNVIKIYAKASTTTYNTYVFYTKLK